MRWPKCNWIRRWARCSILTTWKSRKPEVVRCRGRRAQCRTVPRTRQVPTRRLRRTGRQDSVVPGSVSLSVSTRRNGTGGRGHLSPNLLFSNLGTGTGLVRGLLLCCLYEDDAEGSRNPGYPSPKPSIRLTTQNPTLSSPQISANKPDSLSLPHRGRAHLIFRRLRHPFQCRRSLSQKVRTGYNPFVMASGF